MQDLLERRLISLHDAGTDARFKHKFLSALTAIAFIFLLPAIHFGIIYHIWAPEKEPPNRRSCTCECFDTVFRGRYEWPPSNYKHFYFNSTGNTLKIWLVIILGVLIAYEAVRYLTSVLLERRLRMSMLALLASSLYSHYYGWWGLIQYLNEEYWVQWYHQLFFTFTELLSSGLVLHLCNSKSSVEPWKLLIIFSVNFMHIIIGALDQFIENVIHGEGKMFEALRDLGLMLPDIFHCLVSYFEMRILADSHKAAILSLFYKEELMMAALLVTLFTILGRFL